MKIGHIVSDYLPHSLGGTQLHLRDLCRGLTRRSIECTIFAGERGSDASEFDTQADIYENVPVTRVTNNFRDFDRFDRLYVHPKIDVRFDQWLDLERPDVVHVHHLSGLSTRLVDVAHARGLPVVLTLHDFWLVCPRGQRIHPETLEICEELDRERCLTCLAALWPHLLPTDDRAISRARIERWETSMRSMLNSCELLIAPSDFHRERFVDFGLDPDRVVTVEHGLDKTFLQAPPRTGSVRTIGFVGTVLKTKGVHVLAEAFRLLARPELSLRIHGEIANFHGDTSYGDELRRITDGLAVSFEGAYAHEDLPKVLAGIDLLVVPSIWWESFCLTIREGALAGIPVLASDHGAMGEAVESGIAAGFRPGDAADLARVLGEIIDSEERRCELARNAARIRSIDDCVGETVEHYERLLVPRAT